MLSQSLTALLLLLLVAVVAAWVGVRLRKLGIRPLRRLLALARSMSLLGWCVSIVLLGVFGMRGGEKFGGGLRSSNLPVEDGWENMPPITSTNTTRTLEADDFRRGFVLARVGTDEAFGFAAPSGAVVCADWKAFGAAEDWAYVATTNWAFNIGTNKVDRLRVFSAGKVDLLAAADEGTSATNIWFAPFAASLGMVPEANWQMVGNGEWGTGNGGESQFWHFVTPSNTLQLTWQNVLLDRDTNTPVSEQAEFWANGRFAYRYDLSRCGCGATALPDGRIVNVAIGASLGHLDWTTNAIPTNVTSFAFHPLSPEDATDLDRDGDGLSLLDELFAFGTDPDLADTDRDGTPDGAEVAMGTDPGSRDTDADGFADGTDVRPLVADAWTDADGDGLPDAWKDGWFGTNETVSAHADANTNGISNLAALLMGTDPVAPPPEGFAAPCAVREMNAWEIAPVAFSFARPEGLTNLVSRTFAVGRESPWQQLFVSSRPDRAAGWEMSDATLLYGLDGEPATNAVPASPYDSWRVPLGEAMPQSVSFRLAATGAAPSLSAPLYLLRWTPRLAFQPSANLALIDGTNGHAYAAAKRSPETGAYEVPFSADLSRYPHLGGMDAQAAADLALSPVEGVAVSAAGGAPPAFAASNPLMADLPPEGTNLPRRLLLYDIAFGREGEVSSGPRSSRYASPYPLTSSSLRKSFHRATGVEADGTVTLTLSPDVPELGFAVGAPSLRGGLRGTTVGGSRTATVTPPATVTPTVCGEPCSNDVHEVEGEYPQEHDPTPPEEDMRGSEEGPSRSDDDECDCGEGGATLGSFRFRVPLGESAADENLGYLWLAAEGPVAISPSAFGILAAPGVSVVTNADGTIDVDAARHGGKTLQMARIVRGVAISVWNASGRFESRWEVWNEGFDDSRIRVRRITVLGNATVDETYATWEEEQPEVYGLVMFPATAWEKTDNIRGVATLRYAWRDPSEPDFVLSEYDETRLAGELVRSERRNYEKIGVGANTRRRLVSTEGYDEDGRHESERTYWCDTDNSDRHGRLRSVHSTRQPWALYDYDSCGRETVRIEQLDGSPFPDAVEVSPTAPLPPGCSAKVTATGYAPQSGDHAHRNDSFEPREISVYVRHGVNTPILVSHETRIYTRETDASGIPLRRIVKSIGLGDAVRTETTVEYPQDSNVPTHLRGLPILETAPDGTVTATDYSLSNGLLVATSRRYGSFSPSQSSQQSQFPTYTVTLTDAAYRLPLRSETRLAPDGALLEWSERTYDDIKRLRSVSHSDGTSETNAYSCCRLLWRRDREGRKTLRSAQTGTDSLYYAEEETWRADVATNGFRVTQHFFDGLGRETNTVTYAGSTPGEAVTPGGTGGSPVQNGLAARSTTTYPYCGSDYAVSTDERGKVTETARGLSVEQEETIETTYTNGVEAAYALTTSVRNGSRTTYREWPVGRDDPIAPPGGMAFSAAAWSEETRSTSYAPDGSRIERTVTESSDNGVITNSVSTYDLLGRLVTVATPAGNGTTGGSPVAGWVVVSNSYDGASTRILSSMRYAPTLAPRTTFYIYNDLGEQVGTVLDGVTNRTDTTYDTDSSNVVWRVVTTTVVGPSTNSLHIIRTQLTGLSDACRRHEVTMVGRVVPNAPFDGTVTETLVAFDPESDVETETVTSSVAPTTVRRYRHGILLSTETIGETTLNSYDAFGLLAATGRTGGSPVPDGGTGTTGILPVASYEYSSSGDLLAAHTYTNGEEVVSETYAYDMFGNRISTTDALGNTVFKSYDPFGHVLAERGATYPVCYTYDTAGHRTSLSTTRDGTTWDTTTWTYDHATGNCMSKTYADGSTVTYTYTPDNLPLRTTYASGKWKENVYDSQRRLTGMLYSSPDMDYEIQNDAYGNATNVQDAAGNIWRHVYGFNSKMLGEMFIQGDGATGVQGATYFVTATNDIARTYDAFDRPTGYALAVNGETKGGVGYAYDTDGRISRITATNSAGRAFSVAYANVVGYNCGYTITTPNGSTIRRIVERDEFRRNLVTNCATCFNSSLVDSNAYTFDALARPTTRRTGTTGVSSVDAHFAYNNRSEVVSAAIGSNLYAHDYDDIGNHVLFSDNLTTNTFTHNALNQMVGRDAPIALPTTFAYTPDGGLSSDGFWEYAYDAEDQLLSVTSADLTNGAIRVLNAYDYRHRRISKTVQRLSVTTAPPPSPPVETYEWNTIEYRTFAYDNWNLIYETVAAIDGGTTNISEMQYFWGLDLSGSLQGAGGVGGLLAVSCNGQFYFPTFDNNGNVTKYIDESGNAVAAYEYDDFGRIISYSGPLADFFRHRFSTKYFDAETGLYYYGYRFYLPNWRIWLNRDPIGERDGVNLYSFCNGSPTYKYDLLGHASTLTWAPMRSKDGWYFAVTRSPSDDDFSVVASYTMSQKERKCCSGVRVDRYVKKFLGIGGKYGKYALDHSGDGGYSSIDDPFTGYAEGDTPDGQTLFFYRVPWTQAFKFVAICSGGPNEGKELSEIEKLFKTDGHWMGQRYEGRFVDE